MRYLIILAVIMTAFPSPANGGVISGAEYFFDADPGEGKGISLATKTGDHTFESEITIPPNITIGYHYLYVRMKDDREKWGIEKKHLINVTGTKTTIAAEFYIDADPGKGQGTPLISLNGLYTYPGIDTSALSVGKHGIFVRMKNSDNNWGVEKKYDFEVSSPPVTQAAEYYLDNDGEAGSGKALDASDGTFGSAIEFFQGNIDTAFLDTGNHTVYVRAMDSYARWSKPATILFEARITTNPAISGKIITSIAGWDNLSVTNAEVSLEGTGYKAATDKNGNFVLLDVPAGNYLLTVTAPNFPKYSQQVEWTGQQGLTVDIPPLSSAACEAAGDVDGDGKISLAEAIHTLQILSGTR